MIEKGKISAFQLAILLHPTVSATAVLLVPSITFQHAGKDMWVAPAIASVMGFLVVILADKLRKLFPKQMVTQYTEQILGRFLGKIVVILQLLFFLHIGSMVLRQYSEFITGSFLLRTPGVVITLGMAFVCCLAVRGGVEVVARVAQFFFPLIMGMLVIIFILLIAEFEMKNILPFFGEGITPVLEGAVVPAGWYIEFFTAAYLLPFVSDQEKSLKWNMLSVISVLFILTLTNIFTLLVFGNITGDLNYPVMSAGRYISIADFLEHLESVVMAIWIAGVFIKATVFLYIVVIGTAQALNLSSHKPIVFPIGFLSVLFSFWSAHNLQDLAHHLTIGTFYLGTFLFVLPLCLLCIALIKSKRHKSKGTSL